MGYGFAAHRSRSTVDPKNYREARERVGDSESVKVANNTTLERREVNGRTLYAVRLHATDVVTFAPTWTELDTGGWATMTTADRLRRFSPVRVEATRKGWAIYLTGEDWDARGHPYFDGIRIDPKGTRLMATQPHKPKNWRPIVTESGW